MKLDTERYGNTVDPAAIVFAFSVVLVHSGKTCPLSFIHLQFRCGSSLKHEECCDLLSMQPFRKAMIIRG